MGLTPKLMSSAGKFLNTNKSPIKRTGAPEKNGDSKARPSKVCTEPSTFVIPQQRSSKMSSCQRVNTLVLPVAKSRKKKSIKMLTVGQKSY